MADGAAALVDAAFLVRNAQLILMCTNTTVAGYSFGGAQMIKHIFLTIAIVLISNFSAVIPAQAEPDSVYKMTVGKKLTHVFKGGAEKVIVEVIDGGKAYVEVRFAHFGKITKHDILCKPKCTKTIKSDVLNGIVDVRVKSKGAPTVSVKIDVTAKDYKYCHDPAQCGAPKGWEVYSF